MVEVADLGFVAWGGGEGVGAENFKGAPRINQQSKQ